MKSQPTLVLNPDELGQDPVVGMDLAVSLGIRDLELRTAWDCNLLLADDGQLNALRCDATARGLRVAALAAPLWKWCPPEATPGRVDSFGFPTQVAAADRKRWIDRALQVAQILGAPRVRVFSHLQVGALTETFADDPLLPYALDRAQQAGVRLLLENEPVCTVARPDALLEVLGEHPALGLWLDLGNLHEVGHATVDTVKELAPFTEYVHIKDWRRARPGGALNFCPAGSGEVPYLELLTALEQVRTGLPYGLETHVKGDPAGALAEGAAFLRARAGEPC